MLDLSEEIYRFSRGLLEIASEEETVKLLKRQSLNVLLQYNRFKQFKGQKEALIQAVMLMDDVSILIRLAADLKQIDYDQYKVVKEEASKIVKRLVCEKNIILGSSKAVAERSLGR